MILVPGFTQNAASWAGVLPVLEPIADVTVVDLPECPSFAETAAALADAGGRGCWVGYSMGGRLALRLALDHPELVERLALVSTTPGIAEADARAARVASDEELARSVERDGVDAFLDRWLAQPLFAAVPADAPGLDDRRAATPASIAHQLRVLGTGSMTSMWERLPELTMPVLLVTGDDDAKFHEINRLAHERIVDAHHVTLRGGHALPLEQPAILGGLLAAFVADSL